MSHHYYVSVIPLSYYNIKKIDVEARKCAREKTRNPGVHYMTQLGTYINMLVLLC